MCSSCCLRRNCLEPHQLWLCGVVGRACMEVWGGCCSLPQVSPSPSHSLLSSGCLWPTAGSLIRGLSDKEELLYLTWIILYLHSHNHCWFSRAEPCDSCNTSHVLLLLSRHMFHVAVPLPPHMNSMAAAERAPSQTH